MHPIILKAFHATLGELATADLVLLFIDASEEQFPMERKVRACSQILREVDISSPTIICANKIDKISEEKLADAQALIRRYFMEEEILPVSVTTNRNLDTVLSKIDSRLKMQRIMANSTGH